MIADGEIVDKPSILAKWMAAMQIPNDRCSGGSIVCPVVSKWANAQQTGSVASISPFDIIVFKYQKGRYIGA
jgi:hypothetical protein